METKGIEEMTREEAAKVLAEKKMLAIKAFLEVV